MNERWQEHFDHDVAFHRKTAAIYDHVNTEPRLLANDLLFAPLDRRVAPGDAMLDLGCGTGQMLLRYATRFGRAVGVDHSARDARHRAAPACRRVATGRCTLVESDFFRYLETGPGSLLARDLRRLPAPSAGRCVRVSSSAWCAPASTPDGQLLLAEPVDTGGAQPPRAGGAMERGIGDGDARRADADGGKPRGADRRRRAAAAAGATSAFAAWSPSRGWEMFQHGLPASALDHVAMRWLHARYGRTGNVVAALWQAV